MAIQTPDAQIDIYQPDSSSKIGLIVASLALGSSFQPNLLTRATRDQAIITGLSTAAGYAVGTSGGALLRSLGRHTFVGDSVVFELAAAGIGIATVAKLPAREHEADPRAAVRLAGGAAAVIGAAAVTDRLVTALATRITGRARIGVTAGVSLALSGAVYFGLRTTKARVGAGSRDSDGNIVFFEDSNRQVKPVESLLIAGGVTGLLMGLGFGESYVARAGSRAVSRVFGGDPADHRTAGRVVAFGASAIVIRYGLAKLVAKLTEAGDETEVAHGEPPALPEVTGSPASGIPWSAQTREGRRWLSGVLSPSQITEAMTEGAKQPIRVYASLDAADSEEGRAALLLAELERTNAYGRSVIALFSPTGSGYVNYVATETFEYLTRGDCASAAIEYSVLPSSFSLQAVPLGTRQTQLVVEGVAKRIAAMPAPDRPRFVLFGESLGSQVSQGLFTDQGVAGPRLAGLDAAVWIGTPSAGKWRKQLWGSRSVADVPAVGPGPAYLPRSIRDWHELAEEDRSTVEFLLLQNGDDPIPKFGEQLLWRRPDWLGPTESRPLGSPRGTRWLPVVTFVQTFVDMLNALTPTPGVFAQGGHDYRVEIPAAIREVWKFAATDEQMNKVGQALREHELHWETVRKWDAAEAETDPHKRAKAEAKVEKTVSQWVGQPIDANNPEAEVDKLIR